MPSRYAMQIGELKVLVISDGVLKLPTVTLAYNAEPAACTAWFDDKFLPTETLDWPLNVVVVRSGEQTILIDAGLGVEFPISRAPGTVQRLEAAGIDLASVTVIAITRMHMDHVGGLLVEGVREQFRPDLRIQVATAEVKFWEDPDFTHTSMPAPVPDVLRSSAKRFANDYKKNLRLFDEEFEIAPGVTIYCTGGHTPGRGGPRPHPVVEGSGSERRVAGGHASAVPLRRPCGGRRQRIPLGAGVLGC